MTNILGFLNDLRRNSEEEAYWRAYARVFGSSASLFRAMFTSMVRDKDLSDRQRVEKGLENLFRTQAITVRDLARQALKSPISSSNNLFDMMKPHEHYVHFYDLNRSEKHNAVSFLESGLKRDAKLVCLLPSHAIDRVRWMITERNPGMDLSERIDYVPIDGFLRDFSSENRIDNACRVLEGAVQDGLAEDYQEVWFTGHLAGRAFERGIHETNDRWEAFIHGLVQKYPLTVYCSYPDGCNYHPSVFRQVAHDHSRLVYDREIFSLEN